MRNGWISTFTIKFYLFFLTISLLGNLIINYNILSWYTIVCIFFYVSTFVLGTLYGGSLPSIHLCKITISPYSLTKWLLIISFLAVILGWYFIIRYYGDITNIIMHAYDIRNETIGDGLQLVPVYITYPGSLVYAAFAITLALYHSYREKKILIRLLLLGLLIILTDLQAFGRIGILFMFFMVIGYIIMYINQINFKKIALPSVFMFVVLMLPRWIRGGSSFEGIGNRYEQYTTFFVPEFLTPLLSVFAYYFSGIYALNEILASNITEYAYGQRNFATFINMFNRLFSGGEVAHRVVIIGEEVYVPFDTNIYTIIGELYLDFGILGIVLIPFVFGSIIGYLFKYYGFYADSLKLILFAWLFYTPIYNAFSFGGFFISFMFVLMLVFITDSNISIKKKHDFNSNC